MATALQILHDSISFIFSHLLIINVLLSIVVVFFQRRNPKSVWAWLLILYFIPVLGFVFYLLIGADMHKRKMFRTKEIEDRLANAIRRQELMIRSQELKQKYPGVTDYSDLVMYHLHTTSAILSDDNDVEFFVNGEDKFAALKEDMRNAKKSIHIQYYIIKNDELFRSIVEILKEKVKEGVKVRILYDSMGCWKMRKKIWKQLEKEGIQCTEFFPALVGRLHLRINYRNHRKIVVIDDCIGYVGGFNIGKEYIDKDPKFGHWRDTHMRITGSSVTALEARFILDWSEENSQDLCMEKTVDFSISDDSDFMDALDEAFAQWTEEELSYERLLQEYGADGIATCMFVNAPGRSYAIVYDGEDNVRESLVMFVRNDKGTEEEPAVYAHEILHVFGAHDLYRGEEYSRAVTDYIAANYPDEIMRSVAGEGRISEQISRITAYHLGWIDEIPETESFPELIR